jgi:glyoxylase-like metal-dependent hydrolase (beta-lactamase superfamily II)
MNECSFGPVRFLPGPNRGKYPSCHSIYIEGAGVLIDPASDRERLLRLRREEGVQAVWLSHWHEDHITHLDLFEDLPLWVSAQDAPPLGDLEVFLDWYDMQGPFRDQWRGIMTQQFHYRPRRPAGFLADGQVLQLGPVSVEVMAVPGHTPGSLAFLFREPQVLFLADYDLSSFGPWYGDLLSSIPQTIASVERLRRTPARAWLAGHETGVFTDAPAHLWEQYLGVIQQREARLLELLQQPRTKEEIIQAWIVYGRPREPRDFFYFSEWAIMKKHLERLEEQGRLWRKGERLGLR